MFWIGPVIMQPFPDATGALSNVGIVRALLMHLEVLIGAITEELLATRTEVGEPGDELFGRRGGRQLEVHCGHRCSFAIQVYSSVLLCISLTSLARSISASLVWKPR